MAGWRATLTPNSIELSGELRAYDARALWTTLNALSV